MSRTPPVKRIRTNSVREPGLRTVRDAGLTVGEQRRRPSRRTSPYPVMTIIVAVIGLAAIGWMLSWKTTPAEQPRTPKTSVAAAPVKVEERDPTPRFAQEGTTEIHLAIDPAQLTALAFHQASGKVALHMTSLVPDADTAAANALKAVPPYQAPAELPADIWGGTCLRLWRSNRGGQPDTAADMGADPGTPVWSPVSGTVVAVTPYLLYDKYEDFEIHIKPDGRDDVDAVMIHVTDVVVKPGDKVKGGVTRLASVRQMSDKISIQLGGYTANGGDHCHLQLNHVDAGGQLPSAGGT